MTYDQIKSAVPRASASFLALNGLSGPAKASNPPISQGIARIRQNSTGLNKTEISFFEYLENTSPLPTKVYAQAITLRIANGCRYTPDFFTIGQGIKAYEVKGFMRDDAAVKLKVTASLFPWIKFHLVTRKGGTWQIHEVLP